MRRLISLPLILVLATLIHVDWHFARQHHHRLSLEWSSHWLFGIAFFAVAGAYIARRWPEARWCAAAWNVALALVVAQGIEPVLEAAYYDHQLRYDIEPERWRALWQTLGAGIPVLVAVLWFVRRRRALSFR